MELQKIINKLEVPNIYFILENESLNSPILQNNILQQRSFARVGSVNVPRWRTTKFKSFKVGSK
jgi:hypothetical protein